MEKNSKVRKRGMNFGSRRTKRDKSTRLQESKSSIQSEKIPGFKNILRDYDDKGRSPLNKKKKPVWDKSICCSKFEKSIQKKGKKEKRMIKKVVKGKMRPKKKKTKKISKNKIMKNLKLSLKERQVRNTKLQKMKSEVEKIFKSHLKEECKNKKKIMEKFNFLFFKGKKLFKFKDRKLNGLSWIGEQMMENPKFIILSFWNFRDHFKCFDDALNFFEKFKIRHTEGIFIGIVQKELGDIKKFFKWKKNLKSKEIVKEDIEKKEKKQAAKVEIIDTENEKIEEKKNSPQSVKQSGKMEEEDYKSPVKIPTPYKSVQKSNGKMDEEKFFSPEIEKIEEEINETNNKSIEDIIEEETTPIEISEIFEAVEQELDMKRSSREETEEEKSEIKKVMKRSIPNTPSPKKSSLKKKISNGKIDEENISDIIELRSVKESSSSSSKRKIIEEELINKQNEKNSGKIEEEEIPELYEESNSKEVSSTKKSRKSVSFGEVNEISENVKEKSMSKPPSCFKQFQRTEEKTEKKNKEIFEDEKKVEIEEEKVFERTPEKSKPSSEKKQNSIFKSFMNKIQERISSSPFRNFSYFSSYNDGSKAAFFKTNDKKNLEKYIVNSNKDEKCEEITSFGKESNSRSSGPMTPKEKIKHLKKTNERIPTPFPNKEEKRKYDDLIKHDLEENEVIIKTNLDIIDKESTIKNPERSIFQKKHTPDFSICNESVSVPPSQNISTMRNFGSDNKSDVTFKVLETPVRKAFKKRFGTTELKDFEAHLLVEQANRQLKEDDKDTSRYFLEKEKLEKDSVISLHLNSVLNSKAKNNKENFEE